MSPYGGDIFTEQLRGDIFIEQQKVKRDGVASRQRRWHSLRRACPDQRRAVTTSWPKRIRHDAESRHLSQPREQGRVRHRGRLGYRGGHRGRIRATEGSRGL